MSAIGARGSTSHEKAVRGCACARWTLLIAALALLAPLAGCGAGDDRVLWRLDGRTISDGGMLQPTVWATGPILAITRAREVTGYDAATGERRWSAPLPGRTCGASARPSGGLVAVQFGRGEHGCERIAVIDLRDGRKVWERPITGERHARAQVVAAVGAVVVNWLHGTAAFGLEDGRPLWHVGGAGSGCRFDGFAAGPALVAARTCREGRDQTSAVHGIDPRTGRPLWTHDVLPGHGIGPLLSSSPAVVGFRPGRQGDRVSRIVVLDESGTAVSDFEIGGPLECSLDLDDPARCEHVVVSRDALYVASGAWPDEDGTFPPIRAYDLATGRVLWSTENPDGNHLFPIAMDGDRLIAAQPGVAGFKGRGRPPRLVSVDPSSGETTIMWDLDRAADFPLRSGSYRHYAQGRLFLTKTLVKTGQDDALLAYGPAKG